ncbi:type III pantothenate kinase [Halosquirtibacter laminarini]|uniref:Type III pantothenate kinase n=1 Tax=Halosquirtibacter laminarini TaxID=3374600 RepID=A0AC61ND80_9BACT|nr:type III pantothenate kinase [Prolixibacteraceae bacterium]
MSQLIIDIGNTRVKYAVFDLDKIITILSTQNFDLEILTQIIEQYSPSSAIISDVRNNGDQMKETLNKSIRKVILLSEKTDVPIHNSYKTPETLGKDRLAAVVGAWDLFPNKNSLVIDAGTAITYDFIDSNGTYLGGNISPGLQTRYRALHDYTGKLPYLIAESTEDEIGKDTNTAIHNGVGLGLLFEVERYISFFSKKYCDLHIIITGGDAQYFETKLKNSIFVNFNITLIGLNRILRYNDK